MNRHTKKYNQIEGFFHIKPVLPSLLHTGAKSKDIPISNYEEQYEELKKFNKAGYNIYVSLNSFFGTRRLEKNIHELKEILIDIDYKKGKNKIPFQDLLVKVKALHKTYGIFPVEINETYHGYHLVYALHQDLYFIKNTIYTALADFLVINFGGDRRAKQITGLRRLPNFIDHNSGDEKFHIENRFMEFGNKRIAISIKQQNIYDFHCSENTHIYKDSLRGVKITVDKKENRVDLVKFREQQQIKLEKLTGIQLAKQHYSEYTKQLIENIDGLELIEAINAEALGKKRYGCPHIVQVGLDGSSIDNTDGLKLFRLPSGRHAIKDFTNNNRYGIRNFLLNHYYKIKERKGEEKRQVLIHYTQLLRDLFGINTREKEDTFYVSKKLLFDMFQQNVSIDFKAVGRFQEEGLDGNDVLSEVTTSSESLLGNICYLYILLEKYFQIHHEIDTISYNEVLEMLDIGVSFRNRKKLKSMLLFLSYTYIEFPKTNGKKEKVKLAIITMDKKDFSYKGNIVGGERKTDKLIRLPGELLSFAKGFGQNKAKFLLALNFLYILSHHKHSSISIGAAQKFLQKMSGVEIGKDARTVREHIQDILVTFRKMKLIDFYKKENDAFSFGRRKKKTIK